MNLPDSLASALNSLHPQLVKAALDAIAARSPGSIQAWQATAPSGGVNPFLRGAISADALPDSIEPVRLWFGFYPRCVILLIGETGAGKSSLLYNFCIHAARNERLWDVSFGLSRPLKILYIDPENSGNFSEGNGGQCSVKVERIGQGKPVHLTFHDGKDVDLSQPAQIAALQSWIMAEGFDIVIVDPIANLFNTKDENDNAEAARQMNALRNLSRETGACIVAVHHTGKDPSTNYGRGASARMGAADVAFMFRARGEEEETDDTYNGELNERNDECRLQIVKNRIEGKGSLYLRMDGQDRFSRSTFEDWKKAGKAPTGKRSGGSGEEAVSKLYQAKEEITTLMLDSVKRDSDTILAAMEEEGIGKVSVRNALKELVADRVLIVSRMGAKNVYLLYDDDDSSKGNNHHHKANNEQGDLVNGFFGGAETEPNAATVNDTQTSENGAETGQWKRI